MAYNFLIADDEAIDRLALTRLIKERIKDVGEIFLAEDGKEVISMVLNNHVDIAIIDIEMPIMNGIDAIKELRRRDMKTRIIMNTAYSEFSYAVDALKLEADDYIIKPMVRNKLVEAIENCIAKVDEDRRRDKIQRTMREALENATIRGNVFVEETERILGDDDIKKYVNQARRYILNNFNKDFSLDTVADEIGISTYYLSRVFKKEMGINLNDYLTEVRIEKAKQFISEGNYSIKKLSELCGYNNHTYFCKVFKRNTGMTIGDFRKLKESGRIDNTLEKEGHMESRTFGRTKDGREAKLFTLRNSKGMEVDVIDFGGTIHAVRVPFSDGITDVVLGYDDVSGYENGSEYLGATVGPTVGQVKDAIIELDGEVFNVTKNGPAFNMHGGEKGFSYRYFEYDSSEGENQITLKKLKPEGEEGFPGNVVVKVTYMVTEENELVIHYEAETDSVTVLNLTNHSYFNLDGWEAHKDIVDHYVRIDADTFSPTDTYGMPTGDIEPVEGTPMDFREVHTIGERTDSDYHNLVINHGYDHNYDLKPGSLIRTGCKANDYVTGRPCCVIENGSRTHCLEVYTDYPGIQFYAGNNLREDMPHGKGNFSLLFRGGLCLETQYPTNSMACPAFPSIVLRPGEHYDKTSVYRFK